MTLVTLRTPGLAMFMCVVAMATVRAAEPGDKQTGAAAYAGCAAYYFNAVNVKPVTQYEAVYGQGERAFNEAIKRVGRPQVDTLVAQASGAMMSLMASDWKNFPIVVKRYGAQCETLMANLPAE